LSTRSDYRNAPYIFCQFYIALLDLVTSDLIILCKYNTKALTFHIMQYNMEWNAFSIYYMKKRVIFKLLYLKNKKNTETKQNALKLNRYFCMALTKFRKKFTAEHNVMKTLKIFVFGFSDVIFFKIVIIKFGFVFSRQKYIRNDYCICIAKKSNFTEQYYPCEKIYFISIIRVRKIYY